MFGESYVSDKKTIIASHLSANFGIDVSNLVMFNDFTETCFKSITSLKIWDEQIRLNEESLAGPLSYLSEIISNLNQVVVMGILGLEIPSYTMLRRSLENILTFLYYKDHPIEFFLRDNTDKIKKLQLDSLKQYLRDYPFEMRLNDYDLKKVRVLMDKIILLHSNMYVELSNYVHGKNLRYLELNNYLDDIKSDDIILKRLIDYLDNLSTIVNVLNILFFFETYIHFSEPQKSIIRLSISNNGHFKRSLLDIFGEF